MMERGWVEKPPPREGDFESVHRGGAGCKMLRPKRRKGDGKNTGRPGSILEKVGEKSSSESESDSESDDDDDDDDDGATNADVITRSKKLTAERFCNGEFADEEDAVYAMLAEANPNFIWSPKHGRDIDRYVCSFVVINWVLSGVLKWVFC
jgi:hypothetical protein